MEEEHIAYSRINALAGDFLSVFVVDPETERYREFSSNEGFDSYGLPAEGQDFFDTTRKMSPRFVYPEDLDRYMHAFTRENVLSEMPPFFMLAISAREWYHNTCIFVFMCAPEKDHE